MLKTVFTVNLNEKLLPGRVAIGVFDGKNPCIVAATTADKVLIHNPHSRALNAEGKWILPAAADVNFLNINQTINSLATGHLKPGTDYDVLVIGTPTSIFVYDVQNNTDLFYRDIPDGANVVTVGMVGSIEKPLAIAGGNCAMQGFDYEGEDCYWTVTGDNITSMALYDINEDGQNELLVGSQDYDIRVFHEDAIMYELSETDAVTFLCAILPNCFAYALANGTVGVYHKQERLWRIKSKNQAICIISCDINGDGIPELITGWSSGKVDGRNIETGEVLFKDNFSHSIAAILIADYNMDGADELIVCSVSGEVRGYVPSKPHERQYIKDATFEQDAIRDLMRKKQTLMLELRSYEENSRVAETATSYSTGKASTEDDTFGSIPASTQLKSSLLINTSDKLPSVQLTLTTTNKTVVRTAVIFAEGIFAEESFVVHPNDQEVDSYATVALRPPKDIPVDLHIKAMVGYKGSFHYHVFELTRRLPKFAMYSQIEDEEGLRARGSVVCVLNERPTRLIQWLNKNFLLPDELPDYQEKLQVAFLSLRDARTLAIEAHVKPNEFAIKTDNMELAGNIIQSLFAEHLNLEDLSSLAEFPNEVDNLKRLIAKVEEIQNVRQQLAADIADNSAAVRALVVRAEDARLLCEFRTMKQLYGELNALNRELINEYKIRSQNHQDLVGTLKQINVIIQKAGNLRVGRSKNKLVQACRLAIKQNNLSILTKIITSGDA